MLHGVKVFQYGSHHEYRGEITTLYNHENYSFPFLEDKISVSYRNVLRGLHGDSVTHKLLGCLHGAVYFVMADARPESPTFGKWESMGLNDKNRSLVLIPPGVYNAHLCLTDKCTFWYKLSTPYSGPENQKTIRWDDGELNIDWPIDNPILSLRDRYGDHLSDVCEKQTSDSTIICASGYYNPLHSGHIQMLEASKRLGDKLVVIVNNDYQVALKGSTPFMSETERVEIVDSLRCVDEVVLSIDNDRSVSKTLEMVNPTIFANGGDATQDIVREREVCERLGIQMVFGVGGTEKIQSSSSLIKNVRV